MVNITGLDLADVLACLYNASKPQGMGFLQYDPKPMTREEAAQLLKCTNSFDYLKGRVMKVYFPNNESFDERCYDRDNGEGAAARAIESLRNVGTPDNAVTQKSHVDGTEKSAACAMNRLHEETRIKDGHIHLGLADVKDQLKPKIQEAKKSLKEGGGA